VDELLLVKGVDRSAYEKLSPYVTVWGIGRAEDDRVNVNTADVPVIMSLDERITRELAERAVSYRDLKPFENAGEITKVAGFEGPLGTSLMGRIAVKSSNFHIRASAVERKIKRVIDAVIEVKGGPPVVRYWMES
ncbi:MAG: general secretion pathway protein GspK, partial [Deltaproteobacteria bacterium]|nr:general secretion pathway protein GspK [Deltaproteobacteria bacterium]